MKKFITGFILIILAYAFIFIETQYFGSNWWPESTAEWICDLAGVAVYAIGTILYVKGGIQWVRGVQNKSST
jgi:hypothetical protein